MNEQKAKPGMFPVRLMKNYRPAKDYEVVGYHKPEVKQKDAAGRWVVTEAAAFVEGETMPPPYAGAGSGGKIWADTVIKLPIDEAKRLIELQIAVRADAIP